MSSLLGKIEYGLTNAGYVIITFPDIKGAFDFVQNLSLFAAMQKRGCKESSQDWLRDFLNNRNIQINFKGIDVKKYCTMGTPQGSTSSPMLWNLIADELHEDLENLQGITTEGFADDIVIIATGKSAKQARHFMQRALKVAENWQNRHQLHFAPKKTVVMLITRRRKFKQPLELTLNKSKLPYLSHHKHLGVWINNKLDPGFHL